MLRLFSAYLIFFIAARQKIGHFNAILQFLFVLSLYVPFYTSIFYSGQHISVFSDKKGKNQALQSKSLLPVREGLFARYRVGRAQPSIRFLRIYSLGDSPVYCLNILLK